MRRAGEFCGRVEIGLKSVQDRLGSEGAERNSRTGSQGMKLGLGRYRSWY